MKIVCLIILIFFSVFRILSQNEGNSEFKTVEYSVNTVYIEKTLPALLNVISYNYTDPNNNNQWDAEERIFLNFIIKNIKNELFAPINPIT